MKKTMVFENETAYDIWFDFNEEKEEGHDFIEDRVVIVKGTRTIQNRKFNGFSADATINCKNVKTAIRRFIKELNSNGFNVSEDEFESNCHCFTDCGYVVEIEEIDEDRFYINYMCYQDEVEEEIETEETEATEAETATETKPETTDTETAETEEATDTETTDTETAEAETATETKPETTDTETAETEDSLEKELENLEKELVEPEDTHIEDIKKFKEKSELNKNYAVITDEKFHQLTKTLIKSLFKAIGIEETRKIPFIISNNMVFFNYNGTQYKYYPSQCKIFKKCGRKYQRINWRDFADDNSPTDQKQALGRSPPLLLI